MNCLFFSRIDWANLGYLFSESLKAVGVESRAIALEGHPYKYPQSDEIVNGDTAKQMINLADITIYMHSQFVRSHPKRAFVFHGGTFYERSHEELNALYNPFVEGTLIQHTEFLSLGAKNPHWILPVANESIVADFSNHGRIFGHFPNGGQVKHTPDIMRTLIDCGADFIHEDKPVDWQDNLERIKACDICIEQLNTRDFGLTTLEAALMGKVVITTLHNVDRYHGQYGMCGLFIANTPEELKETVEDMMKWDESKLTVMKRRSREWAIQKHGLIATGKRLKGILKG
jgi:hypothetical protein